MRLKTARLIYFSPTGTTQKIVRAIAKGMDIDAPRRSSLTHPRERTASLPPFAEDVLIIGMPVYEERIPTVVRPCLRQLQGQDQPAVVVAVYGNVGFGLTLKQLANIANEQGFRVVGGAAFIGEHSFSHEALPIAAGRPDERDLQVAYEFGVKAVRKLALINDSSELSSVELPGKLPLMARILPENSSPRFTHPPHANFDVCTRCGACVKVCPMGAIDDVSLNIDTDHCVRCFACVRRCPVSARQILLKKAWLVRRVLRKAIYQRREPRFYL
jgi:ferredoxin